MKRFALIIIALAFLAGGAFAQTLDGFQTAFSGFADDMAATLSMNSTIGTTWSDAYIGGFPHFGAGIVLGTTFAGKEGTAALFDAIGQTVPAELEALGVPVPALGVTAKLGLPFLPIDVGVKGGVVTPEMATALEGAYGVAAEYKNLGAVLRARVLEEGVLIPELSIGVSGSYQTGSIAMGVGSGETFTYDYETYSWTITAGDPELELGWESTSFDLNAQVSKNVLLILTPYAGAGVSFGKSTVTGGLASALSITGSAYGGHPADSFEALEAALTDAGQPVPDISADGFLYTAEATAPVVRVYAGVSLNILVVVDAQLMYVPATKALGASLSARLQL
ncbi:MAG: hypothetical protein JXA15_13110 [Spirochaetales bacterium]|nr:hypothetical protein [Spirochaetales bacterium]